MPDMPPDPMPTGDDAVELYTAAMAVSAGNLDELEVSRGEPESDNDPDELHEDGYEDYELDVGALAGEDTGRPS